ncbi:MAG: T9SS type A sorting domain-containing protein, partial [bacterium]|nr:T9SS type A sorting domain-containing protein [bacterium]
PVADMNDLPDLIGVCSVFEPTPPTATDDFAGIVTGITNTVFPITEQGTTIVTWIFDDGNGNISTQTQNVLINDVTAPVTDIVNLPDITSSTIVTDLTAPTANDNCVGVITGTTNTVLPITTIGTTIITWSYIDGNGNITTQNQNIIISDITAPVPDSYSLPDLTEECSVSVTDPPTATDDLKGIIIGTTNTVFPITEQGTTVVTWTYDDGNGNTSTQTQNVIINDITAPVADIVNLPDITTTTYVNILTAPTAADNCEGTITRTSNTILPITTIGTTVIIWTYDDGNGNISTQTQNVIISDETAPLPDADLPNLTGECSVSIPTAPTATDDFAGTATGTTTTVFPITEQGTTIVTWTYDDGNGNISTQTQNVIINDITSPVADIVNLSDITATTYVNTLTPPTAADNCEGTITGTTNTTLPITIIGTTTITWSYDDGNGNISTQSQNIIISDITAPIADVNSLPDLIAECSVSKPTAPKATDDFTGTTIGTTNTVFPITEQGSTIITWTYDDGNGNISTQTQTVIIDDVTAPVADVVNLHDITTNVFVIELIAPTASDNCSGNIFGVTNTVYPINKLGTTVVTWTYNDGNGNISTQTQNVIITDGKAPIPDATNLQDLSGECSVSTPTVPTATDDFAGTITGITNTIFPITEQGTTFITWTYDDGNGNISTQTQNVIINDKTAPKITSVHNDKIIESNIDCEAVLVDYTSDIIASDNCDNDLIITQLPEPVTVISGSVNLIIMTVTDDSGNSSETSFNVSVHDNTNPEINCIEDQIVNLESAENVYTVIGTEFDPDFYNDNCGISNITNNLNSLLTVDGEEIPVGSTTIVWTIEDNSGNKNTCNFEIQVNASEEKLIQNRISISPNPTKGILKINSDNENIKHVNISDLSGKIIIESNVINKNETIDLSKLKEGIYILKITTNNEIFTTKIVKQ